MKYLTWKYDSPRGISFHQPKTIKKTIQQTVLPFRPSLQSFVWYKQRQKIMGSLPLILSNFPWFCHLCTSLPPAPGVDRRICNSLSGSASSSTGRLFVRWFFGTQKKGPTSDGRNGAKQVRAEKGLNLWEYVHNMFFLLWTWWSPPPGSSGRWSKSTTERSYICFGLKL